MVIAMTNAELAILSLVAEQARHGYEIEELIAQRGMREWTEVGFSSIYYLLKKLEKAEHIISHLEETPNGPARKVYTATESGMAHLREAVLQALSTPQPSYPPIQMGLANLPLLRPSEIKMALKQHLEALTSEIERLKNAGVSQPDAPYFVHAMFDYSISMLHAQMDWIQSFITQLPQE